MEKISDSDRDESVMCWIFVWVFLGGLCLMNCRSIRFLILFEVWINQIVELNRSYD